MSVRKIILPVVGLYLVGMVLFWLRNTDSNQWTVFFYFLEKSFGMVGFLLLAMTTHSIYVMRIALYAVAVCLFMLIYYLWCMVFGHDNIVAIASLLIYSLSALWIIAKIDIK